MQRPYKENLSVKRLVTKFMTTLGILKSTTLHSLPYYCYRFILNRPILPRYLLLGLTYKCNSRCKMCSIWKKKDFSDEMSSSEIVSIFENKEFWKELRKVSFTGGEPFIRKDIPDIVDVLNKNCHRLGNITFNTNGFLVDSIYQGALLIRDKLDSKISLGFSLSLDGIGETHNEIRGLPKAFSLVSKSIEELLTIKEKYPNFSVSANCVLQPSNVEAIDAIQKFCATHGIGISFTFPIVGDDFFCNGEAGEQLIFSDKELAKIKQLYLSLPWSYANYHFIKYIEGRRRTQACVAGYADLYIDPDGNVFPCNYLGESFGNIKESPIEQIWYSNKASMVRKNLPHLPLCKNCVQNCDSACISLVDKISYYRSYFQRHW